MRYLHSQPRLDEYASEIPALTALATLSLDDVARSVALLNDNEEDQFLRRTSIRSSLASIEGVVHALKQHEIHLLTLVPLQLSQNKKDHLTKSWGVPTFQNMKTCLSILAQIVHGVETETLTDAEWSAFDRAIRLRHRITHPKTAKDLEISDTEITEFLESVMLFMDRLVALFEQLAVVIRSKVDALKNYRRRDPRIGRNEPCPCKSGKKYKYCCGSKSTDSLRPEQLPPTVIRNESKQLDIRSPTTQPTRTG